MGSVQVQWLARLSDERRRRLTAYAELVLRYQRVTNLTGARTVEAFLLRHVHDAVRLREALPVAEGQSLLDVGSGAGLPGIPLAIAAPDLKVTLVERRLKRITFLRLVVSEIGLRNVRVIGTDLASPAARDHIQPHDLVVGQAVTQRDQFLRLVEAFVAPKGWVMLPQNEGQEESTAPPPQPFEALEAALLPRIDGRSPQRVLRFCKIVDAP